MSDNKAPVTVVLPYENFTDSHSLENQEAEINKSEDWDEEKKTIDSFLVTERKRGLGTQRDIMLVINTIQHAVKNIAKLISRRGLFRGLQTHKLDIKSHDQRYLLRKCEHLFLKHLTTSQSVCLIGSSYGFDLKQIINHVQGKYIVTYVPIEGNSVLNYQSVSGSVFSIFRKQNKEPPNVGDFLQSGNAILAAGYALYGANTTFVLAPSPGAGLLEFILDQKTNEFVLTDPKLEIPLVGKYYSLNEGRSRCMNADVLEAVNIKKDFHVTRGRPMDAMFTGSVVCDLHTIIKQGGLFISPPYSDFPQGMLRQQFYGNPFAFIMLEAGGSATDGDSQILELEVEEPYQCCPVYMGSFQNHQEFVKILTGISNKQYES